MTTMDRAGEGSVDLLDNAVWHSLRGPHAAFAEGSGGALRYHPDVSVFHAVASDDDASWHALADAAVDGVVVLFRTEPIAPPPGWEVLFAGDGQQMIVEGSLEPEQGDGAVTLRDLQAADVPAMTALVEATRPGPFRPRTVELGGYVGLFDDDGLVAMAGQRLRPPGWCEVSAVCTRPDARRRGYASLLTRIVAAGIAERGERVLLHVASDRLAYERLGFVVRATVRFAALRVPVATRPSGRRASQASGSAT